jgi:hypothetical protein
MREAPGSNLHLEDCPDAIKSLVLKVAKDFQTSVTWPTVDEFHLLREDSGVTREDFNAFGHQIFETRPAQGVQTAQINLWALSDTNLFTGAFADAREIVVHAFSNIKATKKSVVVTRDYIATRLGRHPADRYIQIVEYIFSRTTFGYRVHPDHGWELAIDVQRYSSSPSVIDDLFVHRPPSPSSRTTIETLEPRSVRSPGTNVFPVASSSDKKALVFVSCGQVTAAEIKLGRDICALVDATPGLRSYFAQDVSSMEALSANIFRNLKEASAVIAVMHHRGAVTGRPGDAPRTRASVWIEQEIAIVAFQAAVDGRRIEIAAYAQRGLSREGVRDNLIVNPVEFDVESEILDDVRKKLAAWRLAAPQIAGAHVDLKLGYRKLPNSDREPHAYELDVDMRNVGTEVIEDFEASMEFPAAFVTHPPGSIAKERHDLAHDEYRVFRHGNSNKTRLLPGDSMKIMTLSYQVTNELLHRRQHSLFSLPVTVNVYVGGRLAGTASEPFGKLQNF